MNLSLRAQGLLRFVSTGTIRPDLAPGFIRAECFRYGDVVGLTLYGWGCRCEEQRVVPIVGSRMLPHTYRFTDDIRLSARE